MPEISRLWGQARIAYTEASEPVQWTTKSGSKTTISRLCRDCLPPCRLNPLLFNGHLQTMWIAVSDHGPPIHYKRRTFESDHSRWPGEYAVDFAVPPPSSDATDATLPPRTTYFTDDEFAAIGSSDSTPMLVALHGLSGGSHEVYLRQVLAPVTEAGWAACVVNGRGCAQSRITTPQVFNARATWDIRQTVLWLRKAFPNRPLYGIGFSLGANILAIYLSEEGEQCPLKAAVFCSNPWNLEVCHKALIRTTLGAEVYSATMGRNMQALFDMQVMRIAQGRVLTNRHSEQILKNPGVDEAKARGGKYLHEFDRYVQAPTWGYPTEGAYYRDASSVDALLAIRVPVLAINAEDDPISAKEAIPYEEIRQNPYITLCTTSLGGHLCWFQLNGGRWFARGAAAFLMKMQSDIDFDASGKDVAAATIAAASHQALPSFEPLRRRMIFSEYTALREHRG